MDDINSMVKAVRGYVLRCLSPFAERLKAIEDRPAPKDGAPGEKAADGINGKDGAAGIDGKDGERGRDGVDGKDGQPGRDGVDGKDGPAGKDGAAGIDGKDGSAGIDGKAGEPGTNGTDGKAGQDGAHGRDGIDGKDGAAGLDGKDGTPGARGEKGMDGDPGRDGQEGPPGRDALQIDILDGIDPEKRYQRGTYASFRGGVVMSFKATEPLNTGADIEKAGWQVVVNGIDSEEESDDGRTLTRTTRYTNGKSMARITKIAAYQGIWKEGADYARGDSATREGSTWTLMAEKQAGRPGEEGSGWVLSVKRGRDGKDGKLPDPIEPRGPVRLA